MLIKMIIVLAMICIIVALFSSLVFLVRDEGQTRRTVKALSWRIGLSLALFIFLFIAYSLNWIAPHAL
jgi:hypothetical protein